MSAPPPPKPRAGIKQVEVVKALFPYSAQNPDELSFEEGSVLFVLSKTNADWWKCRCEDKEGLVPANYLGENTATIDNPLHEACKRGNLAFLQELLSQDVSVNGLDRAGNSPLHWACRGGHVEAVELLLAKKPAVNAINKLGDSPLHCAAWAGNLPIVKLLLDIPEIELNIKNKAGETPAQLAKSDEVTALLLQATGRGITGNWTADDEDDD